MRVLVYLGRIHLYEGHDPHTVVHGVRTAIAAGCRAVVLTNAAGGINAGYAVGQPVLISDHLNLTGRSPLWGPLPPQVPSRFTDLTEAYSARLRGLARELDPTLAEGVYAGLPGPHFETPAEIRMLRDAGADLVGMSTVMEAIAARHLGRRSARDLHGQQPGGGPVERADRPPGRARRHRRLGRPGRHAALRAAAPRLTFPREPGRRSAAVRPGIGGRGRHSGMFRRARMGS